jgi:SAM-dependent methyltransferase
MTAMRIDRNIVFDEYNKLIDHCLRLDAPEQFVEKLAEMRDLVWEDYLRLLINVGVDWRDATVLDYGCKYGQMFPLLIALGVKKIIGVEVYEEYVLDANKYICTFYESVTVIKPEEGCYIPLDAPDDRA